MQLEYSINTGEAERIAVEMAAKAGDDAEDSGRKLIVASIRATTYVAIGRQWCKASQRSGMRSRCCMTGCRYCSVT